MGEALISRRGGGGLAINGIIEAYKIYAGETISAGDFVSFIDGGQEIIQASGFNANAESVFEEATSTHIAAVALSATKVVVAYRDEGNSNKGTAVVLTISGTTITPGTPVVFETGGTSYIAATVLSNDKVLVAYRDDNNSIRGTAVVLTISGTSISAGTIKVLTHTVSHTSLTTLVEGTKVLFTYRNSANADGTAVILSVSGTTISEGTPVAFKVGTITYTSVVALSDTKAVVAYRDDENNNYGTAVILTISGTSISAGTPVVFLSSDNGYITAIALSNTKVLVAYRDTGNSGYGTAVILTISGASISVGTPVVFDSGSTIYLSVALLSSAKVIVARRDGAGKGSAAILTISDTTIIVNDDVQYEAGGASDYTSVTALTENKAIVAYSDVGNLNYGTALVLGTLPIQGVAKENGTGGDTINVYTV